ncbi:unnamed protein product, partial [Didymodactylos carnosus]
MTILQESHGGVRGIVEKLKSNSVSGLSGDENDLTTRRQAFGRNEIPPKPPKTFLRLIFEALQDLTLIILIVCAVVSFGLSLFYHSNTESFEAESKPKEPNLEWIEGVAIIIAVIVVVLVTAFNDWTKERQFRGLQSKIESDQKFNVLRNSVIQQLPIKEIVVGDICQVKYGDTLPADGIVIQSNDLKVDESSLTGESDLKKKHESGDLFLLSGTNVMEGSGKMLVLAVGEHSQTGLIFKLLGVTQESDEKEEKKKSKKKKKGDDKADDADATVNERLVKKGSHDNHEANELQEVSTDAKTEQANEPVKSKERPILQAKLTKLTIQIGYAGMTIAILTVLVLFIRFSIEEFIQKGEKWNNRYWNRFVRYFITGVTVLVVAVPEGLPLAVTISLAYAVKKMMRDNNLVRHLDACETMGNATAICSDKTGTLTTNRMTVVQVYVGEKQHHNVQQPEEAKQIPIADKTREIMMEVGKDTLAKQTGNKTECGLLGFVANCGGNYDEIRQHYPSDHFVHVYTFNSLRKNMSTVIRRDDGTIRMHTKGASEIVLK